MKKYLTWQFFAGLLILLGCVVSLIWQFRQQQPSTFEVDRVDEILQTIPVGILGNGQDGFQQQLTIKGESEPVMIGSAFQPLSSTQLLRSGQRVITTRENDQLNVVGVSRLPLLGLLASTFVIGVLVVSGFRGWQAVIGMIFTLTVLLTVTLPWLLAGGNAIVVAVSTAVLIGTVTTYLTHGWTRVAHQTVLSLALTMLVVVLLSMVVIHLARLSGLGTDEAYVLQYLPIAGIDIRGLLLGGIMLGTLGILDDVIIAQVSVVQQLKETSYSQAKKRVWWRSMAVGQDHLSSLVNTLLLAYLGANLPLLLLLGMTTTIPWWVMISNDMLTEEIVRTLLGSLGILLSVPLATAVAVWWPNYKPTTDLSALSSSEVTSRHFPAPKSPKRRGPKATRIKR